MSGVHVQEATTASARRRQEAAVAVLRRLRHPGAVDVVDHDAASGLLVTRWAGLPLNQVVPLSGPEVAGLGAAAATVLGDVHALGVTHNAVGPDHLLVATDGSVTWCGWGSALHGGDPMVDAAALGATLLAVAPPGERRLRRVLADAAAGKLDAAALACRLADGRLAPELPRRPVVAASPPVDASAAPPVVGPCPNGPGAPGPGAHGPGAHGRVWRRRPVAAAGAATCLVALAAAVVLGHRSRSHCPLVDRGCRVVATPGGVLDGPSGRVSVASADQAVVLGRWRCDGDALPAVLDRSTGSLWVYDAWATTGHDVTARFVATEPRGSKLSVRPGAACDELVVGGHVVVRGSRS